MFSKAIEDRYGDKLPEDIKTYFTKIVRSTDRMRALIIDILNFSRLSADVIYFRRANVKNMFAEVLEDFEVTIREKNATITSNGLPELELIPGQFRQVIHNLLSNALKFTKPDIPPVIRLEATRIRERSFDAPPDPAGGFFRFSMTDNGIGFEEKFAENVFKLFQRLHPKDKFEGTGIGLAITKKIIERHNGLISVHTKEGQGARFDWILPITH
jgi:two-component system CheB/CheR fusion protein